MTASHDELRERALEVEEDRDAWKRIAGRRAKQLEDSVLRFKQATDQHDLLAQEVRDARETIRVQADDLRLTKARAEGLEKQLSEKRGIEGELREVRAALAAKASQATIDEAIRLGVVEPRTDRGRGQAGFTPLDVRMVPEMMKARSHLMALAQRLSLDVFGKPPGEPAQEVGGIGVTLLGFCAVAGISADEQEDKELARILAIPKEEFRRRHARKAEAGIAVALPEEGEE